MWPSVNASHLESSDAKLRAPCEASSWIVTCLSRAAADAPDRFGHTRKKCCVQERRALRHTILDYRDTRTELAGHRRPPRAYTESCELGKSCALCNPCQGATQRTEPNNLLALLSIYNMGGRNLVRRLDFQDGTRWVARIQLPKHTSKALKQLRIRGSYNDCDSRAI